MTDMGSFSGFFPPRLYLLLTYLPVLTSLSLRSLAVLIYQSIIQPASFEKNSLLYPKVLYLTGIYINKPIPHRTAKISLPKDRVSPYEHLDRPNVK